jgi:CRP/FNR family transcriptional regulator, dissimilatory nitrate respiration regulator
MLVKAMATAILDRVSALRRAALFRNFSDNELADLARNALVSNFRRGEPLVIEGEPATGLLVLIRGSVRIFREGIDGREQVICIEHAVATLNELQLFDGGGHPASISACEHAAVLSIGIAQYRQKLAHSSQFALDALEIMAHRLRDTFDLIDDLSLLAVDQRLARFLLDQAQLHGRSSADGVHVELTMSNHQIGSIVGAVREVVSRSMSKLQKSGLILLRGRTILIPDLVALARFADSTREIPECKAAAV